MSSSEAPAARPASREIARAAVQAELSLAAYELVVEKGYGNVHAGRHGCGGRRFP